MAESTTIAHPTKAFAGHIRERLLALSDPLHPAPLSRSGWVVTALVVAILLSPAIFFPISPDTGLYFVSGWKILGGGLHYRDIVDLKPPPIYYLYALAALFGRDAIAFRLLDFILQCATCMLLATTVRRLARNDLWGASAAVLYAIMYVSLGWDSTAIPEAYTGLFALGMARLLCGRRTATGFVLTGALAGGLFLFKFTLGIVLAAAIIAELTLFGERWRAALKHCALMAVGFLLVAALFPLYIAAYGISTPFGEVQALSTGYAKLQAGSIGALIKGMFTDLPSNLSNRYSATLFLLTVIGMGMSIPIPARDANDDGTLRVLRIGTIFFTLLTASIVIEGKYLTVHFGRIYPFGALLASYAALRLLSRLVPGHGESGGEARYPRLARASLLALMLLFSPAVRYLRGAGEAASFAVKGEAGFDSFLNGGNGYSYLELRQVGDRIARDARPGDKLFTASIVGGIIHYYARHTPDFKIYHTSFMVAPFVPQVWRDSIRAFLLARPKFIVTQKGDALPGLSGSEESSEEFLHRVPGVDSLLSADYAPALRTGALTLYERRR